MSRLCDRSRRTLSGLDTDRWGLGFLAPTIREWQYELRTLPALQYPRRTANETANRRGRS